MGFKLSMSSGEAIEAAFHGDSVESMNLRSARRYATTICPNV